MKNYDLLKDGSRARLSKMREYAKVWNQKRTNAISWKDAREHGAGKITEAVHGPGYSKDGNSCALPSSVLDGLRDCGAAHEIVRMRHTRWFTDVDGCESISGHVWQLPSRSGSPVYLAGYVEENSGYTVLDCTNGRITMFEEKTDAAIAADRLAEIAAEKEREHAELYNEAREVQDEMDQKRDCLRDARREVSDYIKVLRDLPAGSASREIVCELIYDARRIMKFTIRSIMECREKLADYARRGVEV